MRNRIAHLQIFNPRQHKLNRIRNICLKLRIERSKPLPDAVEHRVMLGHVEDEKDTEKVLRPAEEVWDEAFLACWW